MAQRSSEKSVLVMLMNLMGILSDTELTRCEAEDLMAVRMSLILLCH